MYLRNMMKLILTITLVMLCTDGVLAQKKEIQQAQANIKKGKDLDKAEKLMVDLLAKPENRGNMKIYSTWFDAVRGQYDAQNKKLYIGQAADTAALMNTCRRMYNIVMDLDTIDRKEAMKYKMVLKPLRNNLLSGGVYFMKKGKWNDAYRFFDDFISTSSNPVFEGDDGFEKLAQAAYYATFTAHKSNRFDDLLKHEVLALADTAYATSAMTMLADAYNAKKDRNNYERILIMGFEKSATPEYFFGKLMQLYMDESALTEAFTVVEKALARDSTNAQYVAMGGQLLQLMNNNDDALEWSKKAIALDDTNADAYRTVSIVLMQRLDSLEELPRTKDNRKKIQNLSEEARKYLESYRALREDDIDGWASSLYRVYLNLNMGDEFDEMDTILRNRNGQ